MREYLQSRLAELAAQREQATATANFLSGAYHAVEAALEHLQAAEAVPQSLKE